MKKAKKNVQVTWHIHLPVFEKIKIDFNNFALENQKEIKRTLTY